jgi:galactokinase
MRHGELARQFNQRYGGEPSAWTRAPGRVDLMGSHTDYNLGYVLTLPISRDTWVAARPRDDRRVRACSLNVQSECGFELDGTYSHSGDWGDYLRGVAKVLLAEGFALRGFDAVVHSTVPLSSGLSSSAALECAIAVVFQRLAGWTWDPVRMAKLCQRAENSFVGVNCGILDQYTSCAGVADCALLLDCRDLSSRPVHLDKSIEVVICDTRSKRELTGSEYGERRAQCEEGARLLGVGNLREVSAERLEHDGSTLPDEVGKRCRFIVEENARVLALADALESGDRMSIGRLGHESFTGAADLYEIASPAMHQMMKAMRAAPGVIGARQAGAGFGGCMVAFVERNRAPDFQASVTERYAAATGIVPEVYPVQAAGGAGPLTETHAS